MGLYISGNSDLSALPPCTDTLWEHLDCVNYEVGVWKWVHIAKLDMSQPVSGDG